MSSKLKKSIHTPKILTSILYKWLYPELIHHLLIPVTVADNGVSLSNSVTHVQKFVFAIFFPEPTSKTPKLPESTAPFAIDRSSVATSTVQQSIASSQSQSTTKDYTDYKPHTIKGSTTIATSKPIILKSLSTSNSC